MQISPPNQALEQNALAGDEMLGPLTLQHQDLNLGFIKL